MLANCKRCGNVFVGTTKSVCSDCTETERDSIQKIVQYLRLNRSACVLDVVRDTGIDLPFVSQMIESGKLKMAAEVR